MKYFLIITTCIIVLSFVFNYTYYYTGNLYLPHEENPVYTSKAEENQLMIDRGSGFETFEIKGINLGSGIPGQPSGAKEISKETYLRWFGQIQKLGANVIRVYSLENENFYDAFYEYNLHNPNPLYLIHGVWVDEYLMNSTFSALDTEFAKPFYTSCRNVIDAVHGRYKVKNDQKLLPANYDNDISPWVYGYILGTEWANTLVAYTDNTFASQPQYHGKYLYTENGSNFEIFLAQIGDAVIDYETKKYGSQKVIAFSNCSTTDPFTYPERVSETFGKFSAINTEHIRSTENFKAGQFASYHIYPYYPDYYSFMPNHDTNTYLQYLKALNKHHSMPVLVTEFGVPSSRGMASIEEGQGRNQGFMSEQQQGNALVSMYQDIKNSGSAGGIAFIWQDEWFKQSWNTMSQVDLNTTSYWSDYQSNDQYFGLLSFDPGKEESICYVDGDKSEWTSENLVVDSEDYKLSMKYDEKFIYFLAEKDKFNIDSDKLYLPIDVTPKSGSMQAENLNLQMSAPADFIIEINGKNESRVWVQERYDTTRTIYKNEIDNSVSAFLKKAPDPDSPLFNTVTHRISRSDYYQKSDTGGVDTKISFDDFEPHNRKHYRVIRTYESGKLFYGNANPKSADFNSLADFCSADGFVEIKIPWKLLNFSDPSMLKIHDDYYENLGIEYILIDSIQVGIGDSSKQIHMTPFSLERLGKKPQYHERLKESYYILQEYWNR